MPPDLTTLRDEQLLQSVAESNEPAFGEIYERYQRPLFARAFGVLRCEGLAKDCTQDVFVSIWVKRESIEIENLKSYLHQAVRFQALKCLKRYNTTASLDERAIRIPSDLIPASKTLEFKDLRQFWEGRICALPPDQREVFTLHREQNLTYPQIARLLNISIKTVEKKMSLALRFLRRYKE